ncbi:MAG: AAA family ATPase [Bacteroidota bacterium]
MKQSTEKKRAHKDHNLQEIQEAKQQLDALRDAMGAVIVGQSHLIDRLLIGLLTNGHILLEGVPGLAKSLTVSTFAQVLGLDFRRIQFTPDLLPADLIGTLIYNQETHKFEEKKGPIFSSLILADEINRSPAKVQSALLEAMQERQVSIGEKTFPMDDPFLVLATQNPLEQEGTYPLPEAQVDRFMMKVYVHYPSAAEEKEIMRRMAKTSAPKPVNTLLDKERILGLKAKVDQIRLSEKLEEYIVKLVMATRDPEAYRLNMLAPYIEYGVSPRASLALNLGAKALALLSGRDHVLPEDVKLLAKDVLNHRLILSYEADAAEVDAQACIEILLEHVEI